MGHAAARRGRCCHRRRVDVVIGTHLRLITCGGVDEVTGERRRFSSSILPAWSRRSPRVAEVLPLLYLHGLSSSDFAPALEQFLGSGAGLSAATVTRLTSQLSLIHI